MEKIKKIIKLLRLQGRKSDAKKVQKALEVYEKGMLTDQALTNIAIYRYSKV